MSAIPRTPTSALTPIQRRRTRPSFSPRRRRSTASEVPTSPHHEAPIPTVVLEFEGFSFVGSDGSIHIKNVSGQDLAALSSYLTETYNVDNIIYSEPFIVLGFADAIPAEEERPFSIAGMIAIYKPLDDMYFDPYVGRGGLADDVQVDAAFLKSFEGYSVPPDDTLLYLATDIFPDCEALTFLILWRTLVVELPSTDDEAFAARLQALPRSIAGARIHLAYHHGPLPNAERRSRLIKPQAAILDHLVADETDYVRVEGTFYPGAMLSSVDKKGQICSSASAGILLQRGQEQRLTCSWHNWGDHAEKHPGLLGQTNAEARQVFSVTQGSTDGKPRSVIGFIRDRIGETDFAMAELDKGIKFVNQFMGVNARPQKLVPLKHTTHMDTYVIDSFVTGPQYLQLFGQRTPVTRSRRAVAHPKLFTPPGQHHALPPDSVAYLELRQGVFAANSSVMTSRPHIRDRVCGSILLRFKDGATGEQGDAVLGRGEAVGMMHYADLQPKHMSHVSDVLVYADAFDPLIKQGWSVAQ